MAKAGRSRRKKKAGGRARRFSVRAPVRYREDDGFWHHGTTENISRSGMLLRAEKALSPNTPVELVVELPPVLASERSASVICRGRIVRAQESDDDTEGTLLAAEITSYRFGRLDDETTSPDDPND